MSEIIKEYDREIYQVVGGTGAELYQNYLENVYKFNHIDFSNVFKLQSKDEFNHFVTLFDEDVRQANKDLVDLVRWWKYAPIGKEFSNRSQLYEKTKLEYLILSELISISLSISKRALHIPTFKETIVLNDLLKCHTAFLGRSPFRIVFMKPFWDKLNTMGRVFVLAHEAQHYTRFHHSRMAGRNPKLWNIATDTIINGDLLLNKFPEIFKTFQLGKFNYRLLFKDNTLEFDGVGIGAMSHYLDIYKQNLTEESIYNLLLQKQQLLSSNMSPNISNNPSTSSGEGGEDSNSIHSNSNSKKNNANQSNNSNGNGNAESDNNNNGDSESGNQQGNDTNSKADGSSDDFQDNHIHSGRSIYEQAKNGVFDKYGDYAEEMKAAFADYMSEYGVPIDDQSEVEADIIDGKQNKHIRKEIERMKRQHSTFGSSDWDTNLKRDEEYKSKLRFDMLIENAIKSKQRNTNMWKRSDKLNYISRMSKYPDVNKEMGFNVPIKIYKKEEISPFFVILLIIDTSGSITIEDFQYFISIMFTLIKHHNTIIRVVPADTEAKTDKSFYITKENIDEYCQKGFSFAGGGGTDMLQPLAYELALGIEEYDLAMILSDGYYNAFTKQELLNSITNCKTIIMSEQEKIKSILPKEKSNLENILSVDYKGNSIEIMERNVRPPQLQALSKKKSIGMLHKHSNIEHPPLIFLNTNEMMFDDKHKFKTFGSKAQEFLLHTPTRISIT